MGNFNREKLEELAQPRSQHAIEKAKERKTRRIRRQALTIDQMKMLSSKGLDISDASMYWRIKTEQFWNPDGFKEYELLLLGDNSIIYTETLENNDSQWKTHWYLDGIDNPPGQVIPAYTYKDIVEKLPEGCIYEKVEGISGIIMYQWKFNEYPNDIIYSDTDLLKSSYEMLCWCIENGLEIKTL